MPDTILTVDTTIQMTGTPKSRCPQCRSAGLASDVAVPLTATVTGLDMLEVEAGPPHVHDPNHYESEWSCSRGHRWFESVVLSCEAEGCRGHIGSKRIEVTT